MFVIYLVYMCSQIQTGAHHHLAYNVIMFLYCSHIKIFFSQFYPFFSQIQLIIVFPKATQMIFPRPVFIALIVLKKMIHHEMHFPSVS